MHDLRKQAIIEMLWDYLKKDPEYRRDGPDQRVETGWGTKTRQDLCASIERAINGPLPDHTVRP